MQDYLESSGSTTVGRGCVVTKHGGDSSDDDWLGGLHSDDDEDIYAMAALMQAGLCGSIISVSQAAVASRALPGRNVSRKSERVRQTE